MHAVVGESPSIPIRPLFFETSKHATNVELSILQAAGAGVPQVWLEQARCLGKKTKNLKRGAGSQHKRAHLSQTADPHQLHPPMVGYNKRHRQTPHQPRFRSCMTTLKSTLTSPNTHPPLPPMRESRRRRIYDCEPGCLYILCQSARRGPKARRPDALRSTLRTRNSSWLHDLKPHIRPLDH